MSVLLLICVKRFNNYSCKQSGGGAAQDEGVLHIWGQRSESHVDSLKTVLDIMQDEGSLDSSHGPHTCLLPS